MRYDKSESANEQGKRRVRYELRGTTRVRSQVPDLSTNIMETHQRRIAHDNLSDALSYEEIKSGSNAELEANHSKGLKLQEISGKG